MEDNGKWIKLVTRESTLLERSLRFMGYAEFLPKPFTMKQKDLLVIYSKGMSTQYVYSDDFDSKIRAIESDLKTIGFENIIKRFDVIFTGLKYSSQNLNKLKTYEAWQEFEAYYKQSRAIILYTFNLAKFLKEKTREQDQIDILQKYYDDAEASSTNIWVALKPFFEYVMEINNLDEKIYSYKNNEFSNLLKNGEKIDVQNLIEREKLSIFKLENYDYKIFLGTEAYLVKDTLALEADIIAEKSELAGAIAFHGKVTGRVTVVVSKEDYKKIQGSDVLVTPMTHPNMITFLHRISAIVTDEGGVLCHAAIISRELKKPCIIGTKIATQVLKDGDMVEVDAEKGIVRILKRK